MKNKKDVFPTINTEVYSCKRCGKGWLQRHKVVKNDDNSIKDIKSNRPKNCTECKSKYWNIEP